MNSNKEDKMHEMIDAYINDMMSLKDKLSFESRMEADEILKEEVFIYMSLKESFNEKDWHTLDKRSHGEALQNIKKELKSATLQNVSINVKKAEEEYYNVINKKLNKRKKFYFVAIAASFLLFASINLPYLLGNDSLEDHYNNYADWEGIPSLIEKGDEVAIIEKLYESKDYNAITSHYEIMQNGSETFHAYSLLKVGASYFFNGNYNEALQVFDVFIQLDTIASSRGNWYKLLVYLKQDNKRKTQETLNVILSNKNNYNYKQALKIKKDLK
ncbi:MAG: hypothetical protein COA88_06320 [Kordia sp.]|nr:MAG: hypothetical protein COA88_06320 [Kordia sp.]